MAARCPVFPIAQSSCELGDYDFDPQIQYLKVLEEAREHRRGLPLSKSHVHTNSPNKNQKQQNRQREEAEEVTKKKGSKRRWWNPGSLFFWKTKRLEPQMSLPSSHPMKIVTLGGSLPPVRSYSGPIYGSAELLPSRKSLPATPVRRGGRGEDEEVLNVPYLSLKELNMAQHHRRFSTSSPIYLVT
ncbi:uncharacterized protein LOC116254845 [Nymphaea colorata]|nr:uncharacterized protein LOC116254845 [Nymphaea colorata]